MRTKMRRWNFSTVLNLGEEIKRKLRITVTRAHFPTKICSRESNFLLEASKPYPHLVWIDSVTYCRGFASKRRSRQNHV